MLAGLSIGIDRSYLWIRGPQVTRTPGETGRERGMRGGGRGGEKGPGIPAPSVRRKNILLQNRFVICELCQKRCEQWHDHVMTTAVFIIHICLTITRQTVMTTTGISPDIVKKLGQRWSRLGRCNFNFIPNSPQRPTTSSGWKWLISVKFGTKHL